MHNINLRVTTDNIPLILNIIIPNRNTLKMKIKFTQEFIDTLESHEKRYEITDAIQKGLLIRIEPTGSKTYYLRIGHKKTKIASADKIALEDVREYVRINLDKSGEEEINFLNDLKIMTLNEFYFNEAKNVMKKKTKEKTHREYFRLIESHILPVLGDKSLRSIRKKNILELQAKYGDTKFQANAILRVLSIILNLAIDYEYIDRNYCVGIKKYKVDSRKEFLNDEELYLFNSFIHTLEKQRPLNALLFKFLLFTGCRKLEALTLRKDHIHSDRIEWENTKTGDKTLPRNDVINYLIEEAEKHNANSEFVFFQSGECTEDTLKKLWTKLREKYPLFKEKRIHDLRHTYGTLARAYKIDIHIVQSVLGHSSVTTTEIYSHSVDEVVQGGMIQMNKILMDKMNGSD